MKKAGLFVGKLVFWLGFPALMVILYRSKRTRVLIVCGDEFLVLRNWLGSGSWILPGGGVHRGEEPLIGLIREVREETGIELDDSKVTHLFQTLHRDRGVVFSYDCYMATLTEKPRLHLQKREIVDYAWVSLDNPGLRLAKDVEYALARWKQTS